MQLSDQFIILTVTHLLFLSNNTVFQYVAMRLDIFVLANVLSENIYSLSLSLIAEHFPGTVTDFTTFGLPPFFYIRLLKPLLHYLKIC